MRLRVRSRQPLVDTRPTPDMASGEGRSLAADGYALAFALCAGLPLACRAGLLGFLAGFEPDPAAHRAAVIQAHLSGHMARGTLTPDGVQAALEALETAALPPGTERKV